MNRNKQTQCERIYDLLSDGRWHPTEELREQTKATYPPARIQDLQRRGYAITDSWEEWGGRRIHGYRMILNREGTLTPIQWEKCIREYARTETREVTAAINDDLAQHERLIKKDRQQLNLIP
jgi:hypothetical protein